MASVKDPNGLYGTITKFEGFSSTPYWDVNGYAIGFGSHINPVTGLAVQPGDYISQDQASALFGQSAQQYIDRAAGQVGIDTWNNLSPSEQNALTSLAYNYGSVPSNVVSAVQNGNDPNQVADAIASRASDNGGVNSSRRLQEADMVRNDQNMPSGASGYTGVPADLKAAGYEYAGSDSGGAYYSNPNNPNETIQYNTDTKQWERYDATTGDPITNSDGSTAVADGNFSAPPTVGSGGTGGIGGLAGGAGGALGIGSQGGQIGGAGCVGGGLSPAGLLAAGGIMGNLGGLAQGAAMAGLSAALGGAGLQGIMGSALGSMTGALGNSIGASLGGSLGAGLGQALGGAIGGIVAGQNPLQALTGSAFGALSQMGSSLIPGLSNVLPAGLTGAAVNGLQGALGAVASGAPAGAAAQFAMAGGLGGAINGYISNMTGNYTLGALAGSVASGAINGSLPALYSQSSGQIDLSRYANVIQMAAAVTGQNRTLVGSISEAMSQNFGNGVGGVGSATRNMQDAMTFSVSSLGQNINAVAADMIAMGTWDASNLMRFMQPGHVATQIISQGLGDTIGLNDLLINANIPVAGIDNPVYDQVLLAVMTTITDPNAIATIQTAFSMTTALSNLGDLCNLQKMMPTSYQYLPVNNFRELGIQLSVIGISIATTVKQIGLAFSKIQTSTDLNHISQLSQPLPTAVASQLMQVVGYGGGSLGEQTMADVIGTVAGYVHTDTVPVIAATNKTIMDHPAAATLATLTQLLADTAAGKYTDLGSPGDPNTGVPEDPGGITVPFPAGTQTFSTLDDALLAFIPLIEAEQQALLNNTDPVLQDALSKLEVAYNASCAQLIRENNNLQLHNIDLFNPIPPSPSSAVMFAQSLDYYGLQTGYGQPGEFLERVASNDVYGDATKYCMRQARNGAALEELGINVEKYKLPQSLYYRDPETFYQNMYTGQMPAKPQNQTAVVYPRTPQDTYIFTRNQALANMGMADIPLLNNQKDEIYYDSIWANTDQSVLEGVGRTLVKTAIDRNITISGNQLMLYGANGPIQIGEIKTNGLVLTNNDYFITTMLNLVNKLLYGNLQTTKYSNPFNTDQMVFGLLELLAQVNPQNITALMNTVTGGLIANGLLAQLMSKFGTSKSLFDTSMDRNEPGTWGTTGPDTVPNVKSQQ